MKKIRTEKQYAALEKALEARLVETGLVHAKAFRMSKKQFAKQMKRLKENR